MSKNGGGSLNTHNSIVLKYVVKIEVIRNPDSVSRKAKQNKLIKCPVSDLQIDFKVEFYAHMHEKHSNSYSNN